MGNLSPPLICRICVAALMPGWVTVSAGRADPRGGDEPCRGHWAGQFELTERRTPFGGYRALASFDDGFRRVLVGAGASAGVRPTNSTVAAWNGERWEGVGAPADLGQVGALLTRREQGKEVLYVGGRLGASARALVARWDGAGWAYLPGEMSAGEVRGLGFFDDGQGPRLYATGAFWEVDGQSIRGIARWCEDGWCDVGGGLPEVANTGLLGGRALAVYDDGSGPALYVGGRFAVAGAIGASCLARWNGVQWSEVSGGVTGSGASTAVTALATFDDGAGPSLFVGGVFKRAGTIEAFHVARWDGAWHDAGGGFSGGFIEDDRYVATLAVADLGTGARLYAGGNFLTARADGTPLRGLARWSGTAWEALGLGMARPYYPSPSGPPTGTVTPAPSGGVYAIAQFDSGQGPRLYAGGPFEEAGMIPAAHLASWDGTAWERCGKGCNAQVEALEVYDDGRGPALFAGGGFSAVGGITARAIARWDGTAWESLGKGLQGWDGDPPVVHALTVVDSAAGPRLCAGGSFYGVDGAPSGPVARWDGTAWSPLGLAVLAPGARETVRDLAVFDDGLGKALFAAGSFGTGQSIKGVVKHSAGAWTLVGQVTAGNAQIDCLSAYDDGTGDRLYVGGWFHGMNGAIARRIAQWDGASWTEVGGGAWTPPMYEGLVHSLAVYNSALHMAGVFTTAGGLSITNMASWNGNGWAALGQGTPNAPIGLLAMQASDTGSGDRLWVAGAFPQAGTGALTLEAGCWDGARWSRLGQLVGADVHAVRPCQDSDGLSVYFGGLFFEAGGQPSAMIAKWTPCSPCLADCDGDRWLSALDFACFQTKFALRDPYADCDQSGTHSVDDYICFQTRFAQGCP